MMDSLSIFGLCAVSLMLLTYALEERSPWFTLAFAGSCALGSTYGFLQGAWPFGLVEGIWSIVALRKWWTRRRQTGLPRAADVEFIPENSGGAGVSLRTGKGGDDYPKPTGPATDAFDAMHQAVEKDRGQKRCGSPLSSPP